MLIRRPLCKLDLGDQLRLEPDTVLHFFSGERPLRAFLFRQIRKGTNVDLFHHIGVSFNAFN